MKLQDNYKKYLLPVVLASFLYIVESLMPKPLPPWMRIGLANIIPLILLEMQWKLKDLFIVVVLRVLITSVVLGNIFSFIFFVSLISSCSAVIVMYYAFIFSKKIFSIITISVVGAITNITVQIIMAAFLILNDTTIFKSLPIFYIYALLAGSLTGYLAMLSYNKIQEHQEKNKENK